MTSSTGDPGSGGGGPVAWFRRQEPAIKAAVIALIGALCAALLGATVTLTVALINRPRTVSAAPDGEAVPSSSSPAPDTESPDPPTSTASSPAATESAHSPKPTPTPSPTPSPTLTSIAPEPAPARTRWHGKLTLDGTAGVRGWLMDDVPPGRAPVGDVAIRGPQEVYGAYAIAAWSGSAAPGAQQCSDLLTSNPGPQQVDVQVGDMACFTTEGGRTGYLTVTATPDPDHITIEATVWSQG